MNKAILSTRYPQFAERLMKLGYQIIPSETIPCQMEYERDHADLQCLILDQTAFVLSCCTRIASALKDNYRVVSSGEAFSGRYPDQVCLSAVNLGNNLICRIPSLDDKIKEYCSKNNYQLIHVNQGYAKCACAVVSNNAIITADKGIYNSIKDSHLDVLQIEQGRVKLHGAEYGLIGGASAYDNSTRTLYFCGNIERHPDRDRIHEFCRKHGTTIISLTEDDLTDIGGIIFC